MCSVSPMSNYSTVSLSDNTSSKYCCASTVGLKLQLLQLSQLLQLCNFCNFFIRSLEMVYSHMYQSMDHLTSKNCF